MAMITTSDGTNLFYKDWGPKDAQPLMFHHGWPLSADDWDSQMLFFRCQGYRVIAHDRRGHGRSDQTDMGNDMDTYAADVAALVKVLDLYDVIHIGHSTGGGEVARYAAQAEPGRVARAVLIGAVPPVMVRSDKNPDGTPMEVFDGFRKALSRNRAEFYRGIPSGPFYGFNREGAETSQGLIDNWWRQGMAGGAKAHYDCIKAFSETDFTEDLEAITVPILFLHGEDDQIVPIGNSAHKAIGLVRDGTLKTYPRLSHGMFATHPEVVNPDLLAFARGRRAEPPLRRGKIMTDTMKAIVLEKFGGYDAFALRDVPVPAVGPRQVRVRVHATAINPLDYQIRRGDYVDYVPLPAIIGHDVSGVVEEKGVDVSEFEIGDEVYYTPKIFGGPGSYAEQHAADVDLVARKPRNINHLEAASLTLVGGTVWEALVARAQLAVHETILIHGGAGGVGTVAIQLAKAMGARVITTVRSGNHEFVRSLGADEVIDYTSDDYVSAVADLTHGQGVNVVFDTVGGDTLSKSPLALADAGRVVSIVDIAQPQNLIEAWGKNAAYHFVFTRQNRGKLDALTNLVERGLIKPVIGAVLPLARVGDAHELLEAGSSLGLRGKVAVDVTGQTVAPPTRQ